MFERRWTRKHRTPRRRWCTEATTTCSILPSTMSVCPPYAPFFGFAGVASAIVFSTVGAAYGTSKSGIGIAGLGTFKPELIMKSLIPVVMSGIIAVYGLVVSVLIVGGLKPTDYSLYAGFIHLGAGLACGFTGLAAGYAIGYVGDSCVRAYVFESKVFVTMVLILIFGEVLGLYGLIVALIMNSRASEAGSCP
ncbi:V-type ATPase [Trametes elegans]|nr:V-type ATPase [Trametes elegans]